MIPNAEPTNLSAVAGVSSIILDWDENTGSDIVGYNIYRSLQSGTGYSKVNNETISTSTYTDLSITSGQSYYYVVKAVSISHKESGASNEVEYTLVNIEVNTANQVYATKIYPNPASTECTVKLSLDRHSNVSVSILDLSGRELHHFIDKQQWKPGEHKIMLPLYGFEKGTYVLNIKVDNQLTTELLVIN